MPEGRQSGKCRWTPGAAAPSFALAVDIASIPLPPHGPKPERIARPRPAASLVLLRDTSDGPALLMGRRPSNARFMPNRWVFPGGAVDRSDQAVRFASPLPERLASAFGRPAAALAACAIRETFEETGLRLAGPSPPGARSPGRGVWAAFRSLGCLPDASTLVPLCRLITPTFMAIRFDARFFAAPAEAAQGLLNGGGELTDLRWVPLGEARGLDLAVPQRVVLAELSAWLDAGRPERAEAPLWREIGDRLIRSPRLAAEPRG